ncbi:MAG: aminodeoxychorismate lyase [Motiliproteus sp.]
MSIKKTLINGIWTDQVNANDRGLSYGDGVFETLKIHQQNPVFWTQHLGRLRRGCDTLGINFDTEQQLKLERELQLLCRSMDSGEGVVKIVITRGSGGRGYRPSANISPQRILSCSEPPLYPSSHYGSGIELFLCNTRLSKNPTLAGIKHLNRLEQVLARSEWQDQCEEGVVRDYDGFVIEGTMSNLFLLKDGGLITSTIEQSGVQGVVRDWVIKRSIQESIPLQQQPITLEQLYRADGIFMTNSLIGIWPVRCFQQRQFAPQLLIRRLQQWLRQDEIASAADYAVRYQCNGKDS